MLFLIKFKYFSFLMGEFNLFCGGWFHVSFFSSSHKSFWLDQIRLLENTNQTEVWQMYWIFIMCSYPYLESVRYAYLEWFPGTRTWNSFQLRVPAVSSRYAWIELNFRFKFYLLLTLITIKKDFTMDSFLTKSSYGIF